MIQNARMISLLLPNTFFICWSVSEISTLQLLCLSLFDYLIPLPWKQCHIKPSYIIYANTKMGMRGMETKMILKIILAAILLNSVAAKYIKKAIKIQIGPKQAHSTMPERRCALQIKRSSSSIIFLVSIFFVCFSIKPSFLQCFIYCSLPKG